VLGQALALTVVGTVLGIAGALTLARVLKGLLFEVSATDPSTYVGIAFLLIAVAMAASYIPARRAARIEPTAALRGNAT
jgi:ABC-type antimicrobial peptide transport system permease subunit